MKDKSTTKSLKQELERLTIASNRIRDLISNLENTSDAATKDSRTSAPRDQYGNPIQVGDRVRFPTRGKFQSTSGIVKRFSRAQERVLSTDNSGNEIVRSIKNVAVEHDC